jgi:SAM-dependent methyltransferase
MNYGYRPAEAPEAAANGDAAANGSVPDDYYCVNLYRRVAGAVELRGKDVLEVGCGRGGGAALVARDLRAASMVGVDLSPGAISHCRDAHREPNLRFFEADAEDLPFTAGSFDAVINVESSHCYPNMRRFLDEVHRVLRPDGVMLFADVRAPDELPALREHVSAAGFSVLEEERMTPGVVRALELDNDRRVRILDSVPRPWRVVARNFIGAESGEIFASFQSGQLEYIRFALRREATPPAAPAGSAAAATTADAVAQG